MITTPPRCASLVQVGHHAPFCYANFSSNLTKRAWRPHAAAALAAAALAANATAPSLPRLRCRCGAGSDGDPLGCGCGGGGDAPPCTAEALSHSTFCWFEADAAGDCDFGGLLAGATYNASDRNPNLEGYTAAWADYNASDPNATAPTLVLNASDPLFNVSLAFDFWPGYVWRDGLYDTQEQCDAGRCSDPHRSNTVTCRHTPRL